MSLLLFFEPRVTGAYFEAKLSGTTGDWTDISDDVIGTAQLSYGIRGAGPKDLVADTGTLTFNLNNAADNMGGALGYYSIGHSNASTGFVLGIPIRLALVQTGTTYSTTYYKFYGWLDSADPVPGQYGPRIVRCVATDWMDEAARARLEGVATQVSQASNAVLSAVVAAVKVQPNSTDFDTGASTFAYALDNSKRENTTILGEIQRIAQSEYGRCYIKGSTGGGGVLTFENRTARLTSIVAASFADTMVSMKTAVGRESVINHAAVVSHPRRVDASSTSSLFVLQGTPLVGAGSTSRITGLFNDPSNRAARVGGTDLQTPASTTDYNLNTVSTGGGTDLTTGLSVTADYGGDGVDYVLVNSTTQDGYVTKLQARGKGLYDYDPVRSVVQSTGSQDSYGRRELTLDMPYESDANTAKAVAQFIVDTWEDPSSNEITMGLYANSDTSTLTQVLAREPGDCIQVLETASGVASAYHINAVDLSIEPGSFIWCNWLLSIARIQNFWQLDTTGYSQLDQTTVLAPL